MPRLFRHLTVAAALLAAGPVLAHDGEHGATATAFGQPGQAAQVHRRIAITMRDIAFEPASITVKAGETVRFVITNRSGIDHDFTLGDSATQLAHRQEMQDAMDMGAEHHHHGANAVMVKAGETRQLLWKFGPAGQLEFDCNVPGHYEAGMKGTITVVPAGPKSVSPSGR